MAEDSVPDPDPRKKKAELRVRMGDSCRHTGDAEAARAAYEEALELHPGLGGALAGLGLLHAGRGELEEAEVKFAEAAERLRAGGLEARATEAESNMACMLYTKGEFSRAAEVFERTLAERRASGDAHGQHLDLTNLANCRLALGELEAATALYEELAQVSSGLEGHQASEGAAWLGAGHVHLRAERFEEARASFERARVVLEGAGDALGAAQATLNAGDAAYRAEDTPGAIACYQRALPSLIDVLPALEVSRLHSNLGSMLYERGDIPSALSAFEVGLAHLPEGPEALTIETHMRGNRGLALLAAARFDEGRADLQQARQAYVELGEPKRAAYVISGLSELSRYDGDLASAVAFHREVMALESEHGFVLDEPGGLLYAPLADPGLAIREATGEGPPPRHDPAEVVRDMPRGLPQASERPVVIFAPPVLGTWGPLFPRGATVVATFLKHNGIPAVVVPISHYVDMYAGSAEVERQTRAAVQEVLATHRPRAVGLSVTFSYLYSKGLEIARMVRELDPKVPITIGGPHVTYWDKECLAEAPEIDVVVRGEGEWTALELFQTLAEGGDLGDVLGITYREGDAIVRNKRRPLGDVRSLPPVDFGILPRAFNERMEITGLTSRGCKFKCTFCHEFRYWGTVVRDYAPERVVAELERVAVDYGNTMRGIDDSMLSMLDDSYFALCDLLGKSPHRPEMFNILTRIDTISPEGLEAMKVAGITSLSVGLESGSEKVLKTMNKGYDLETAQRTLAQIKAARVGLAAFLIVGHPGDDLTESEKTIQYIDRLFREELIGWIDLSIFTPYPGTPYFTKPEAYGIEILSVDFSKWRRNNHPIAQLKNYSASEIYLSYLRMLQVQAEHHARKQAEPHVGLRL